jgi:Tfp pilus assembly protein PilF
VDDGLRLHPGDARLTHASGLLALDNGDRHRAMADFDRALAADPRLIPALVSRATLAHENGDHTGAIADLDAALAIDQDNPDLLYNRGFVHQEAGHWAAAVRDYTRALAQPGADRDELLRHRGRCHAELGDDTARDADLAAAGSSAGMAELTG